MSGCIEEYRTRRMIIIGSMDLAILAELVIGMYVASHAGADLTATFVQLFFSMFAPTLAVTFVVLRVLRSRYGQAIKSAAQAQAAADQGGGLVIT
jgi:hypothetical protein